jgi:glucose-1-phosphate adenylyltransferase
MARKDDVLAIILGGGQGTRLFPLTKDRAKPAVPLAGKYRLVDISVSNCINSGITKIYVLTQFNSASLNRHISRTYQFGPFLEGFVDILAAEQTLENRDWFQGTADAVRRGWRHFEQWRAETYLILAGDHLYRMDYRAFLAHHERTRADVTLSVVAVEEGRASDFGLLKTDAGGWIVEFREKPRGAALQEMRTDTARIGLPPEEAARRPYLASMGIYVFRKSVLRELLEAYPQYVDFGREIIPEAIRRYRVQAYLFDGYWEDIGTIRAFYEANIGLTLPIPRFNLYDPDAPIYTHPRYLPPAKIRDCRIHDCLIADGSILNGAELVHCVIGVRSRIERGARLVRTIVMGADFYQTLEEMEADRARGIPVVGIGEDAEIVGAIIDKNARIGAKVRIVNAEGREHADGDGWYIRDGIVVVPRNAVIPEGTVI